jgi:hypothetical protein
MEGLTLLEKTIYLFIYFFVSGPNKESSTRRDDVKKAKHEFIKGNESE